MKGHGLNSDTGLAVVSIKLATKRKPFWLQVLLLPRFLPRILICATIIRSWLLAYCDVTIGSSSNPHNC